MTVNGSPPSRQLPTPWEAVSTLVLLGCFLLPIWPLFEGAWGWSIFAVFYFWPACLQIGWGMWRHRCWPSIIGGPSISWAGQSYGITGRRTDGNAPSPLLTNREE